MANKKATKKKAVKTKAAAKKKVQAFTPDTRLKALLAQPSALTWTDATTLKRGPEALREWAMDRGKARHPDNPECAEAYAMLLIIPRAGSKPKPDDVLAYTEACDKAGLMPE